MTHVRGPKAPSAFRHLFRLEFDGAGFCGWQKQADEREAAGRSAIQSLVEEAIARVTRSPGRVVVQGCGRTDAGVHAEEFFAHFDLPEALDADRVEKLRHGVNSVLAEGVAVTGAWSVPDTFHALAQVEQKTYEYRILLRRSPPTLERGRCLWLPVEPGRADLLNLDRLRASLASLVGEHDFTAFTSMGNEVQSHVRRILATELVEERLGEDRGRGSRLRLRFTGEGFLKQMVRNLVGTLLEIAQGKRPADDLERLLREAAPRTAAGFCAAPEGLFLTRVRYGATIESLWMASESRVGSGS